MLPSCDPRYSVITLIIHIYAKNSIGHNIGTVQVGHLWPSWSGDIPHNFHIYARIGLDIILALCRLASCDLPDRMIALIIHIYIRNSIGHNIGTVHDAILWPDLVIFLLIQFYARNRIGHNIGTVQVALLWPSWPGDIPPKSYLCKKYVALENGHTVILVLCMLPSCDPSDLVIFLLIHIYARNRIKNNIGTVQVALLWPFWPGDIHPNSYLCQ